MLRYVSQMVGWWQPNPTLSPWQQGNGELPLDYNNNQEFDEADGLFNGPQYQSAEVCGQVTAAWYEKVWSWYSQAAT